MKKKNELLDYKKHGYPFINPGDIKRRSTEDAVAGIEPVKLALFFNKNDRKTRITK